MIDSTQKKEHMLELAAYRRSLWENPKLKFLFLELTLRCNERCVHCGSCCGNIESKELTLEQYKDFLFKIKQDFGTNDIQLCITGGEPLLRKDFFDIVSYADSLGFSWGMTSNGTLIDDEIAADLEKCGMSTISISIDGMRESHDRFRRTPGGWDLAIKGINSLISRKAFEDIQVTTVVHKDNIEELEQLYNYLCTIDIDSWRLVTIEPIGRAKDAGLNLNAREYKQVFDFIREKRAQNMPVLYGCTHYLGVNYEREVRDWYFLCNAGVYTAGIRANGDIGACLDIEMKPEILEGNILKDDFTAVWKNGFKVYRTNLYNRSTKCLACSEREFCGGGSFHSWDFEKNEQRVCFKGVLF
jgi:Predicted Fe-S oxidoreductases